MVLSAIAALLNSIRRAPTVWLHRLATDTALALPPALATGESAFLRCILPD